MGYTSQPRDAEINLAVSEVSVPNGWPAWRIISAAEVASRHHTMIISSRWAAHCRKPLLAEISAGKQSIKACHITRRHALTYRRRYDAALLAVVAAAK